MGIPDRYCMVDLLEQANLNHPISVCEHLRDADAWRLFVPAWCSACGDMIRCRLCALTHMSQHGHAEGCADGHPVDDELFMVRRLLRLAPLAVDFGGYLFVVDDVEVHTVAIKCIEHTADDMRSYPGDIAVEAIVRL
jgi:hypothetical protein